MVRNKAVKKEIDLFSDICDAVGDAEILDNSDIQYISTGNFALDYIISGKFIGGGVPLGRIVEVYGESSTGKTVIGTHLLQGVQKVGGLAVLIDSENAFSIDFGSKLGIIKEQLIYMKPDTLEACFDKIIKIVNVVRQKTDDDRPILIVYDSIASSPSIKELTEAHKDATDMHAEMGLRAKTCSQMFRIIASLLAKQNACLVTINQTRSKIGVIMGNPMTTAGGGKSLEFYCSVRLECRKQQAILDSRKRVIGIMMSVKCTKNKVNIPFGSVEELQLFFNYGIAPASGLLKCLELEGIVEKNASWYYFVANNGEKLSFQSKDFEEIIVQHPYMLGADNVDRVMDMLSRNKQMVNVSRDAEFVDKEIVDEE